MEPRREERKTPAPRLGERARRFRIVKLEERIAPSQGGNGSNNCPSANTCNTCTCYLCVSGGCCTVGCHHNQGSIG
jgi:hypothetical protein